MYTGHTGLALGVKGYEKKASLWLLCVASFAPDLVDFSAQLLHVDTSLWTHSLPGMLGSAVLFYTLGWILTRSSITVAALALLASSHVLADLLTSRLRLWSNGPEAGLHWYLHPILDLCVVSSVVIIGWLLYGRSLPERRQFSMPSFAMLALLLVLQGYMATLNIS